MPDSTSTPLVPAPIASAPLPVTYYAAIDANAVITGWYNSDIYPPNADGSLNAAIPPNAVVLSAAQWLSCISNGSQWQIVNGAPAAYVAPVSMASIISSITIERDRRLYGGFIFNSVPYQTDATSISNILGASQLAFMAIVAGAKQGDTSWAGGSTPFVYIAMDNSQVQMDAYTTVLFAKAAATFRSTIIYCGRALKDAVAAGQTPDVYADTSWGMNRTSPTSTYATDPAGSPAS